MNKAERAARNLLTDFKINKPPVPVDLIAKKLGVILSFEPFKGKDDISGILYRDKKNRIIGINSAHSHARQRFSIAHELGHLTLHSREIFVDKVVKINFRDNKSSLAVDREEISANVFAAELLMPKNFVINEMVKFMRSKASQDASEIIDYLARIFDVSMQAMEYRLMNLGLITSH